MLFKKVPILTAAFAAVAVTSPGLIAASAAAPLLPGCHSIWIHGGPYSSGAIVSAPRAISTIDSSGVETTISITKNFKCLSGTASDALSHCPVIDPSDATHAATAWSDEGQCSPTIAASTPPLTDVWNGVGCPPTWSEGVLYNRGELAEIDGIVYQCSTKLFLNLWCGRSFSKPGDSSYWKTVWTVQGACNRGSPAAPYNFEESEYVGGCPEEFVKEKKYKEGDKVMADGFVYACREWPESELCKQDGYEPNGSYSHHAWNRLGHCNGKSFVKLVFNCLSHHFNIQKKSTSFVLMLVIVRDDCSKHLSCL